MKKFLTLMTLAALAALTITGCGSSSTEGDDSKAVAGEKPGSDKVTAGPASAEAQK